MALPREEEDQVPEWVEGHLVHMQFVQCPRYVLCNWNSGFIEEFDEEDDVRKAFEEHWKEDHG